MFEKMEIYNDNKLVEAITNGLDKKCRTCFKNNGVMNLFTTKFQQLTLYEMFPIFSLPKIDMSDGLPQKICGFCAKMMIEMYTFKLQTDQIHSMLQIAAGQSPNAPKLPNESTKVKCIQDNQLKNSEPNKNVIENKNSTQVFTCPDCQVPFKIYTEYVCHRLKVIQKQNEERKKNSYTFDENNAGIANLPNIAVINVVDDDDDNDEIVFENSTILPAESNGDIQLEKNFLKLKDIRSLLEHNYSKISVLNNNLSPVRTYSKTKNVNEDNISKHSQGTASNNNISSVKTYLKPKNANEDNLLKHATNSNLSSEKTHVNGDNLLKPPQVTASNSYLSLKQAYLLKNSQVTATDSYLSLQQAYLKYKRENILGDYSKSNTSLEDAYLQSKNVKEENILKQSAEKADFKSKNVNEDNLSKNSQLIVPKGTNVDLEPKKNFLKPKCVVCNLEFNSTEEYIKHKQEKSARKKNSTLCPLCNKKILPNKIKQHKLLHEKSKCRMSAMLVDAETGDICCTVCKAKFDSRLRYLLHKRCKNKQNQPSPAKQVSRPKQKVRKEPCPICNVAYSTSILNDHINTHTNLKPYMCEICGIKFRFLSNLRSHQHDKYLCDVCGKLVMSSKSLRKHILTTHSNVTLSCDKCNKVFKNPISLKYHLKRHKGERPYLCTSCGKAFSQMPHLKTHMNSQHNKETILCVRCNKKLIKGKDHKCREIRGTESLERCKICNRAVVDMETHDSLHKLGHDLMCGFCNKVFLEKDKLKSHVYNRVCCRKFEFSCDKCPKKFRTRGSLTVHVRTHTGERPYSCEECGKRFVQFTHLSYHRKLHTGEKHFECPYCEKRFALKGNLTQHIRMHTGEKPHVCEYCLKGFPTSSSLRKHQRIHVKHNN